MTIIEEAKAHLSFHYGENYNDREMRKPYKLINDLIKELEATQQVVEAAEVLNSLDIASDYSGVYEELSKAISNLNKVKK